MEPLVVTASALAPAEPVPLSPSTVDTVSAETAAERDILTVRQALELIPNVAVSEAESARAPSFSVRGSHEITFHEFTGGRTGVGFYLDDIPCSDAYGRDLALFAVERISFYKGPHGTAFGVPNSMGVFDVVTRPPGPVHLAPASTVRRLTPMAAMNCIKCRQTSAARFHQRFSSDSTDSMRRMTAVTKTG